MSARRPRGESETAALRTKQARVQNLFTYHTRRRDAMMAWRDLWRTGEKTSARRHSCNGQLRLIAEHVSQHPNSGNMAPPMRNRSLFQAANASPPLPIPDGSTK
jgi:hypothetical protein